MGNDYWLLIIEMIPQEPNSRSPDCQCKTRAVSSSRKKGALSLVGEITTVVPHSKTESDGKLGFAVTRIEWEGGSMPVKAQPVGFWAIGALPIRAGTAPLAGSSQKQINRKKGVPRVGPEMEICLLASERRNSRICTMIAWAYRRRDIQNCSWPTSAMSHLHLREVT